MPERSADWIRQAQRDLESAMSQLDAGFFEWASFIAQQGAEKAVKAIYQKLGADAWGHAVTDLLKGLGGKVKVPQGLIEKGKNLDRFYIPARYPNGWSIGTPSEYITQKDAKNAISDSEKIIRFCKNVLAK